MLCSSFPPGTFYFLKCSDSDGWCGDSDKIENLPLGYRIISRVSVIRKAVLFKFFYFIFIMFAHDVVGTYAMAFTQRSEDGFMELVLSTFTWVLGT